jgi:hypothetical protein
MQEVNYHEPAHADLIFDSMENNALLLDLNSVFAVVALPTPKGVHLINAIKKRLPGKAYGGLIANYTDYIRASALSEEEKLSLLSDEFSEVFTGCFLRLPWQETMDSEELIMNGTFQGLILSEPFRSFAESMHDRMRTRDGDTNALDWLICSSANISGDPGGSIVDREAALKFGRDRGIHYLVSFSTMPESEGKGSFPIFSYSGGFFKLERNGPGSQNVISFLRSKDLLSE